VNIGFIIGDAQTALIDTGLDESTARKAVQAVEQAALRLVAVINTHSHADRCGGNAFVVKRTGAPIYAPPAEAPLIQHTEFEPIFHFGAAPFKAIDSKWFHAAPTPVTHLLEAKVAVCGVQLEVCGRRQAIP
jgi:glyoxylase-like metal-dependent hydrolase (beta-lactamase superfamily II)